MAIGGIFVLLTGMMIGKGLLMIIGAMNTLLGVLFATRPIMALEHDHVALKNLWGMTLKRHEFASLKELAVERNTIFRDGPEGRIKVATKGMARGSDWARVVEAIRSGGGSVS